jgi:topoisomerase IA-like protein
MPQAIITKPFKFAHGGIRVEEFSPSKDPQELTDECAEVAYTERWARPFRAQAPRAQAESQATDQAELTTAASAATEAAAATSAPETAAAESAPEAASSELAPE